MSILLTLLTMVTLGLIGYYMIDTGRLYHFTLFFTASFVGFTIPQLIGLSNETGTLFTGTLPEGSLEIVTLMSILCVLAAWMGDLRAVNAEPRAAIHTFGEYDYDRLVRIGVGLTVLGVAISQGGLMLLSADYRRNLATSTQWSGPVTIIHFFQSMQKYGFAVAVLLYFKARSPLALFFALFGVITNFLSFTVVARRGAAADTIFIVILGLFFGRKVTLPAWVMGTVFVIGALWVNNIGHFRGNQDLTFWERVESADMIGSFRHTLTNGGYELANAAVICWCAEQTEGEFDFGKMHWNQLVHAYFPGQIFGADVKRGIKFDDRDLPRELLNYKPPPGTTQTGMSDAFASYWYLGCIKFFIIGYVMGRWYNRGVRGDFRSQLAYMAMMGPALHTITHGTYWLMNQYLHMVIFAYPCLYWARKRHPAPIRDGPDA